MRILNWNPILNEYSNVPDGYIETISHGFTIFGPYTENRIVYDDGSYTLSGGDAFGNFHGSGVSGLMFNWNKYKKIPRKLKKKLKKQWSL